MNAVTPAVLTPQLAAGASYTTLLKAIHTHLRPKTYFEIGTMTGRTLALAECASLAVDPVFRVKTDVIGRKPSLHVFQKTSDDFFRTFDPTAILGDRIDLAFLDGMHLYEFLLRDFINTERHCRPNSVIALHDCVPSDVPMTRRVQHGPEKDLSSRPLWWTGDVWKVVLILKAYRLDLSVVVTDAAPTGLVLITNLDPSSRVLEKHYGMIVQEMADLDLAAYGLSRYINECELVSAESLLPFENLTKRYWL